MGSKSEINLSVYHIFSIFVRAKKLQVTNAKQLYDSI